MAKAFSDTMQGKMSAAFSPRAPHPTAGYETTAKQFDGRKSLPGACLIDIDRLCPDPDQPRRTFPDDTIDELAASLMSRGQLQPIRVRWEQAIGKYVIIVGERRYRAGIKAGLKTMECVVVTQDQVARERYLDQVLENTQRESIPPVEQAASYRHLMQEFGFTQQQLADLLKIKRESVTQALRLLELPEAVQAQVDEGAINASAAYEIAKADPAEQATIATEVVEGGLAVTAIRERVARSSRGRAGGKARPKPIRLPTERKHRAGNGLRVLVTGRKGFDLLATIEALEDALASFQAQLGGEGGAEDHDAA